MNKGEITSKRQLMRERKNAAIAKICGVINVFSNVQIKKNYIITGSQALVVQGFMTNRNGDDVDIRLSIPTDPEEKARVFAILQNWASLNPKEDNAEKYDEKNCEQMFTFYVGGTKVNVFAMPENEFNEIPCNLINGYFIETVASVVFDKLHCGRGKDYQDIMQSIGNLINV